VKAEVRAMVETKEINLAVPLPALPPIDLLLLRNVLIYFDLPTKQDILVRVHKTLSCDGVLMLGGTETALGTDAGFERCTADDKATWYRQRPTGRR